MQIITIVQAPYRVPSRPRLLIAKASTIWLWPGIPLTDKQGGAVCSIPPDAIRFWISKFMGPEIVSQPIPAYIASAAEYLAHGDDVAAQRCLDRAPSGTFSPEGATLAQVVAARLGIDVPAMPIAKRMPLWDRNFIHGLAPTFDRFAEAADWLDKAGTFDPNKHDRWDAGSTEGKPGAFKPMNKPGPSVPSVPRSDPNKPGIGHNGGPPLLDGLPEIPPEDIRAQNPDGPSSKQWPGGQPSRLGSWLPRTWPADRSAWL